MPPKRQYSQQDPIITNTTDNKRNIVTVTFDEPASKKPRVETSNLKEILDKIISKDQEATARPEYEQDIEKLNQALEEFKSKTEMLQETARQKELETMLEQEKLMNLNRNNIFLNRLNELFKDERYMELPNSVKTKVEEQISIILKNAVADAYSNKNMTKNRLFITNIQELFNGIITFYTEMSVLIKKKTPEVAAKIGSGIAGAAIIGAASIGSVSSEPIDTDNATLLIHLANFLSTSATTGVGLYFLKNSGIKVEDILGTIGKETIKCVQGIGQLVGDGVISAYKLGINTLEELLNQEPFGDDSQSSIDMTVTTASTEASDIIENILDNNYDLINIKKECISNSQVSDITMSCEGSQDSQGSLPNGSEEFSKPYDIDGGKTRRRNSKRYKIKGITNKLKKLMLKPTRIVNKRRKWKTMKKNKRMKKRRATRKYNNYKK